MVRTMMTLSILLTALTLSAAAQDGTAPASPQNHAGYASFDAKAVMGGLTPNPDILIPKGLLQAGGNIFEKDQSSLAEVSKSLDFVRVQVFKNENMPLDTSAVRSAVEQEAQRLVSEGWIQVANVEPTPDAKDKTKSSKHTTLLMKFHDNGNMLGMVVIDEELPEKFVYVNLGGNVSPDALGQLCQGGILNGVDLGGLGATSKPESSEEKADAEQPEQ